MPIRLAREADAGPIAAIYNDAVRHTTAIWNDSTVDADDRRAWIRDHDEAGYPVLVASDETGAVLGYATFGDWRAWEGYRYTVEDSVYVRADRRGRGLGTALMRQLIARARRLGKHAIVAGVSSENAGSIRLHRKLGFVPVGSFPQVGAKFGRWLDLTFLQLTLDERPRPDAPSRRAGEPTGS